MTSESIFQYGSSLERGIQAQANSLSTRLSTWIMVGHGAALLLCFNAMAAGHICDWSAIQPLARLFLLGLGTAFLATVLKMYFLEKLASRWMKINPQMLAAASHAGLVDRLSRIEPVEEEHAEAIKGAIEEAEAAARKELEEMKKIATVPDWINWLSSISNFLLWVSALSFVAALVCVIEGDQLTGALCASG